MSRQKTSPIWKISKEEFRELILKSKTYKEALGFFGLKNRGHNFRTLKRRILEDGADDSQIKENNKHRNHETRRVPLEKILTTNSSWNSSSIRPKLIKAGLLQNICSECGQKPEWNGKPLVLQLDHINGDSTDNRIQNLRILCPHCHSQTSTFAGRSLKKIDSKRSKRNKKVTDEWRKRDRVDDRKVVRPTKEELEVLIKETSWTELGRRFGVSDNAVRKWAKRYGIIGI